MHRIYDDPARFGLVTRVLHWTMAALFAWQFAGMIVKVTVGRSPLTAFLVGTHGSVGALLLLLLAVRGLWGLYNLSRRPSYAPGFLGLAAVVGHLALYGLMLVVPMLALLRQYGSDRPFLFFGIELLPGRPEKIEWMMAPADLLHGVLGWTLLALIIGHILMVLVHRYVWNDGLVERMLPALHPHRTK